MRVIVLDGAGDHFCGGADIVARNAPDDGDRGRASAASSAGCRRRRTGSIPLLLDVQTPVVCAVRGWAAGIGFQLALAADFTVAADDAAVLGAVHRTRVHPRQRRDLAAAAARRRGAGPRAAAARARAHAATRRRRGARSTVRCRAAELDAAVDERGRGSSPPGRPSRSA